MTPNGLSTWFEYILDSEGELTKISTSFWLKWHLFQCNPNFLQDEKACFISSMCFFLCSFDTVIWTKSFLPFSTKSPSSNVPSVIKSSLDTKYRGYTPTKIPLVQSKVATNKLPEIKSTVASPKSSTVYPGTRKAPSYKGPKYILG